MKRESEMSRSSTQINLRLPIGPCVKLRRKIPNCYHREIQAVQTPKSKAKVEQTRPFTSSFGVRNVSASALGSGGFASRKARLISDGFDPRPFFVQVQTLP